MPERPDLRKISGNIRDALADCDRDTLLDILTFVFKEYVVEGPPPLLLHQAERIEDLETLSFAQLITALQTRLDHPELSLFQVDGDQVSVRIGGTLTPLQASRGAASAGPPSPQAAPSPTPRVQVIETDIVRRPPGSGTGEARSSVDEAVQRGRGDLAGMAQGAVRQAMQAQEAAPPRRGVSIRGRQAGGSMMSEPPADPGQAPAAAGGSASPARGEPGSPGQAPTRESSQPSQAEPPADEDSAAARFSLLELD